MQGYLTGKTLCYSTGMGMAALGCESARAWMPRDGQRLQKVKPTLTTAAHPITAAAETGTHERGTKNKEINQRTV